MTQTKPKIGDYQSKLRPTWCPGCGNFVINQMMIKALVELEIPPHRTVITYDIGCNGNGADKIRAYSFKSLHGRSLPPAIGVKYANHDLTVLSVIGDGGLFWEGAAHWIATAQRNEDITVLVWDNQIYGLTTGQTSPTTQINYPTKTWPKGSADEPINPISVSLAAGASFVARGWVGKPNHLKDVIKQAIKHKGFALVDILQTCFTFNNLLPKYQDQTYIIDDNHDKTDKIKAYKIAEQTDKFGLGVFYQVSKPTIYHKYPILKSKTLINQTSTNQIDDLLAEFE